MKKSIRKIMAIILSAVFTVCSLAVLSSATVIEYGILGEEVIVKFGSYPTLIVEDVDDIIALNNLAEEAVWSSYNYYSGEGTMRSFDANLVATGETAEASDFMEYTDVEFNGKMYRGVKYNDFRPVVTSLTNDYSTIDGYYTPISACPAQISSVCWFEYTELLWTVLDMDTGLVISLDIIDSQPYTNIITKGAEQYFNDQGEFASDWATSTIRAWLNEEFYETAFASEIRDGIVETDGDNVTLLTADEYAEYSDGVWGYFTNYAQSQCNGNEALVFWLKSENETGFATYEGSSKDASFAAPCVFRTTKNLISDEVVNDDDYYMPANAIAGICPAIHIDTDLLVEYVKPQVEEQETGKPVENNEPEEIDDSELTFVEEENVGDPYNYGEWVLPVNYSNNGNADNGTTYTRTNQRVITLRDLFENIFRAFFKFLRTV